jgi:hypothetical protein
MTVGVVVENKTIWLPKCTICVFRENKNIQVFAEITFVTAMEDNDD